MPQGIYPNGNKGLFRKGQNPWNKGKPLTEKHKQALRKKHKPLSKETKLKMSLAHKGEKHSKEHNEKVRQAISGKNNYWFGKIPANLMKPGKFGGGKFANVRRGWYKIANKRFFFRSNWEANYARYLEWLKQKGEIKKWEYEKKVFIFEKIQLGTRSYRPDFRITNNNGTIEYHEVKGWMTSRSKTQLKRMAKYFPEIKLILIDGKSYNDLKNKLGRLIGFE